MNLLAAVAAVPMGLRRALLVLYLVPFFAVQLLPKAQMPSTESAVELAGHITIYFLLGGLVGWATGARSWLVFAIGILIASLMELVQGIIPGRITDVHDLAGNFVGTLLGAGMISASRELVRPRYASSRNGRLRS